MADEAVLEKRIRTLENRLRVLMDAVETVQKAVDIQSQNKQNEQQEYISDRSFRDPGVR